MRASLAFALLLVPVGASALDLGTLFHSRAEREALDRVRRGESASMASVARPDPVITGYVKRSDGKSTVFVDKRPYPARDAKMQGLLEPRIIKRFEPMALPPEPAALPDDENGGSPAKAAGGKAPAARPGSGKAE